MPNYLQDFLFRRVYPQDWTQEEVISEQRAALKRDYEANLAEIDAHERAERGPTPADTDTDVEHAEAYDDDMLMVFGELRPYKQPKLDC